MEMRDPASAPRADEQTTQPTPAAVSADESQNNQFETAEGRDPEAVAEA